LFRNSPSSLVYFSRTSGARMQAGWTTAQALLAYRICGTPNWATVLKPNFFAWLTRWVHWVICSGVRSSRFSTSPAGLPPQALSLERTPGGGQGGLAAGQVVLAAAVVLLGVGQALLGLALGAAQLGPAVRQAAALQFGLALEAEAFLLQGLALGLGLILGGAGLAGLFFQCLAGLAELGLRAEAELAVELGQPVAVAPDPGLLGLKGAAAAGQLLGLGRGLLLVGRLVAAELLPGGADLALQRLQGLPALLQVGRQLGLLAFQGHLALAEAVLVLGQAGLLGGHGGGLDAQGGALAFEGGGVEGGGGGQAQAEREGPDRQQVAVGEEGLGARMAVDLDSGGVQGAEEHAAGR